jgi:cation transport regulator ChaC
MSMSTAKLDPAEDHYIIGYGSIINNSSRQMTLSKVIPNYNEQVDAVAVVLSVKFGYKREWCYRSSTGFTALGLMKCSSADSPSSTEEEIDPYDGINGVLFRVPNLDSLHAFDQREKGYYRVLVPFHYILVLESLGDPPTQSYAKAISKELYQKKIWVYIPEPCNSLYPDENYPILQTYVDICFRGCLQWGGEEFAIEFLRSTSGWSNFYLNDAPMSRRPWLHRPDYMIIDKCLQQLSAHVCYTERRHPEDYASQHLTSLRGIWNVPPRSKVFTGP